jgi:hypothetical protein
MPALGPRPIFKRFMSSVYPRPQILLIGHYLYLFALRKDYLQKLISLKKENAKARQKIATDNRKARDTLSFSPFIILVTKVERLSTIFETLIS